MMSEDEDYFDGDEEDDDPVFAVISPIKRTKWAFAATLCGGISAIMSAAAVTISGMADDWATMCVQRDLWEQRTRDRSSERSQFEAEASKDIEALKGFWITPEVEQDADPDADRLRVNGGGDARSE